MSYLNVIKPPPSTAAKPNHNFTVANRQRPNPPPDRTSRSRLSAQISVNDHDSVTSGSHSLDESRSRTRKNGIFSRFKGQKHVPETISASTTTSTTVVNSVSSSSPRYEELAEQAQQAQHTIEKIQGIIGLQERREQELTESINDGLELARAKLALGNKQAALRHMRKVKLQQNELVKVGQVISTLDAQLLSIESALNNSQVVEAMSHGSQAMKTLGLSADAVDSIMLDVMETMDYKEEVDKILSQPAHNVVIDDEDLLQELGILTLPNQLISAEPTYPDISTNDMNISRLPLQPSTKIGSHTIQPFELRENKVKRMTTTKLPNTSQALF